MENDAKISFIDLGLSPIIISALNNLGYKRPSLIQEKCIPYLLKGYDLLGIAQTGSGKTAAFGLPLLNNININLKKIQTLILVPTRELAIQVSKSINSYSKYMNSVKILAIYGGQSYSIQIKLLKKNPQIIIGTPGRLIDLLKRKTLNLININSLVLDEADKMLKMGFIEDVKKIMYQIPKKYQIALFSATMPIEIRHIIKRFMKSPKEINIQLNKNLNPDIKQTYWIVSKVNKKEALERFLEIEKFEAAIIFVRTKSATIDVSDSLKKRGFNCLALNGDMNQNLREKTLDLFRNGKSNILIATDVAARGLDIKRISLVINYDIPIDLESYIHRIGRTGRAGNTGKAILFVNRYEYKLLNNIKKNNINKIKEIQLPSIKILNEKRQKKFIEKVQKEIKESNLEKNRFLLNKLISEKNNIEIVALALLKIAQKNKKTINFKIKNNNLINKSKFENKKKSNYISIINQKYQKQKTKKIRINVSQIKKIKNKNIINALKKENSKLIQYIKNIKIFKLYSIIEFDSLIPYQFLNKLKKIRILNTEIKVQIIKDKKQKTKNKNF